jgi:hypothetical protein
MSIPDRSTFENIYPGQPPWDIGRPQKAFIDVADRIPSFAKILPTRAVYNEVR